MARRSMWVDTNVNLAASSGSQSAGLSLMGGFTAAEIFGWTVTRLIFDLGLHSTTVGGAWGVHAADLGIGIVSAESFAAGIFPDPVQSTEKPIRGWLYKVRCAVSQNSGGQVIFPCRGDLRSGRKIDTGVMFLIINNTPFFGTTFTLQALGTIRALVLLP